MSVPRNLGLQAFHDGELSFWRRWQMQARLRRSPALREELAALRSVGERVREHERDLASPNGGSLDLWNSLEGSLRAIDAEREVESQVRRGVSRIFGSRAVWGGLAASTLALLLVLRFGPLPEQGRDTPLPPSGVSRSAASDPGSGGSVRFLDTGGAPVLVLDNRDDVTVIWLVDS